MLQLKNFNVANMYFNDIRQARRQAGARKPLLQHHMHIDAKTLTLLVANNKGTDQPAYPRSLISAFVIRYLKTRSDIY